MDKLVSIQKIKELNDMIIKNVFENNVEEIEETGEGVFLKKKFKLFLEREEENSVKA